MHSQKLIKKNEMKKNIIAALVLVSGIIFITLSSMAQLKFDKDWTLRKDMPVFSNPENKSVQANIYQNDTNIISNEY